MKRLTFLASLFGCGAAAQTSTGTVSVCYNPINKDPNMGPCGNGGKPIPNKCPVCGAMAKAYKRRTLPDPGDCMVGTLATGLRIVPCQEEDLPKPALTRCENCNAAFWQDDE